MPDYVIGGGKVLQVPQVRHQRFMKRKDLVTPEGEGMRRNRGLEIVGGKLIHIESPSHEST